MQDLIVNEPNNDTTHRILEAAIDIFAEVGFAGARVDEIAKRAGVNKSAIYYHIGDKEALYAEALRHFIGDAVERSIQNIQEVNTPEEQLKRYIHNLAYFMEQRPHLPPIMLREIASGGSHISGFVTQFLFRLINTLADILETGEQQGVFIPTAPIAIHFMIIGSIILLTIRQATILQQTPLSEALQKLNKNFSGNIAEEVEKLVLRAVKK